MVENQNLLPNLQSQSSTTIIQPTQQQPSQSQQITSTALPNLDQLAQCMQYLQDQKSIEKNSVSIASFSQQIGQNQITRAEWCFLLVSCTQQNNFNFEMQVLNLNCQSIYKKAIDSNFSFQVYNKNNQCQIKWVDTNCDSQDTTQNQQVKLFIARLYEISHQQKMLIPSQQSAVNINVVINKCKFEHSKNLSVTKIMDQDEIAYLQNTFGIQPKYSEAMQQPYLQSSRMEIENEHYSSSFKNSKTVQSEKKWNQKGEQPARSRQAIAQAVNLDRTFASSGQNIDVFRFNHDNECLENILQLPVIKTFSKEALEPSKILMNDKDSKMIILDKSQDKKIYHIDINKCQVIQEIGMKDQNVSDIVAEYKDDRDCQMILAINEMNIHKLDPRLNPSSAIVGSKEYKTNNKFTCISSNVNGNFAAGSQNGDIRLYKQINQNAKNLYHGFGDNVYGIDSTKDGKWLVATCKNYLIVLPTHNDKTDNGYLKSLTKDKPAATKLTISPEHMAEFGILDIDFNVAKFDQKTDRFIVTSTGVYLLIWSMKDVLANNLFNYSIQRLDGNITCNEFQNNQTDKLYVAMPEQLRLQVTNM